MQDYDRGLPAVVRDVVGDGAGKELGQGAGAVAGHYQGRSADLLDLIGKQSGAEQDQKGGGYIIIRAPGKHL